MATRRVEYYIGSTYIGYGQKGELSPDISNDTISTFDGPVSDIGVPPSWEITLDRLKYAGTVKEFIAVEQVIYNTLKTPQNLKIVDSVTLESGETAKVTEILYSAALTDKKASFDAETRTVENLAFKGTKVRKWVNGKEITIPV